MHLVECFRSFLAFIRDNLSIQFLDSKFGYLSYAIVFHVHMFVLKEYFLFFIFAGVTFERTLIHEHVQPWSSPRLDIFFRILFSPVIDM